MNLVGTGWNTLFAPQSMPVARQSARLSKMVQEVMAEPELQKRFEASQLIPVVSSAEETEKMLAAYRAQWTPVVKRSGFKPWSERARALKRFVIRSADERYQ